MKSMTGYGRGAASSDTLSLSVEASSVNRRSLEVTCSLPRDWLGLEKTVADFARARFHRGKVTLIFKVEQIGASQSLSWDSATVNQTLERLRETCVQLDISFQPDAELLLRLIGMVGESGELPSWDTCLEPVEAALGQACDQLEAMRSREGQSLLTDLEQRLGNLADIRAAIAEHSADAAPTYRTQLLQRLKEAGIEIDLNDERVLKEIALFADRCDVAEELTRLDSHLEQMTQCLVDTNPVGRKMDFLCQELNRELHTIGSKSASVEVSRQVIEGRNELERIREQVQNVE